MTDTIKKTELLLVIEMLAKRANESEIAARETKGYKFHRLHGQAYAYREAVQILRDTAKGISWQAIRDLKVRLAANAMGDKS